jgi:hypothetical protein
MPSNYKPEKGKLSPTSLERFLTKLNNNQEQKELVMNELSKKGFCVTVSEYFDLNAHQKDELQTVSERDCEIIVTDGVLSALRRNGKIELIHEGHNPPNLRMDVSFGRVGTGIGIRVKFTC